MFSSSLIKFNELNLLHSMNFRCILLNIHSPIPTPKIIIVIEIKLEYVCMKKKLLKFTNIIEICLFVFIQNLLNTPFVTKIYSNANYDKSKFTIKLGKLSLILWANISVELSQIVVNLMPHFRIIFKYKGITINRYIEVFLILLIVP